MDEERAECICPPSPSPSLFLFFFLSRRRCLLKVASPRYADGTDLSPDLSVSPSQSWNPNPSRPSFPSATLAFGVLLRARQQELEKWERPRAGKMAGPQNSHCYQQCRPPSPASPSPPGSRDAPVLVQGGSRCLDPWQWPLLGVGFADVMTSSPW